MEFMHSPKDGNFCSYTSWNMCLKWLHDGKFSSSCISRENENHHHRVGCNESRAIGRKRWRERESEHPVLHVSMRLVFYFWTSPFHMFTQCLYLIFHYISISCFSTFKTNKPMFALYIIVVYVCVLKNSLSFSLFIPLDSNGFVEYNMRWSAPHRMQTRKLSSRTQRERNNMRLCVIISLLWHSKSRVRERERELNADNSSLPFELPLLEVRKIPITTTRKRQANKN